MPRKSEAELYPKSHRFLMGRLRHILSADEKRQVEDILNPPKDLEDAVTVCSRGDICTHSTLLLDGFMLRSIDQAGKRHIVCIQVPGDFVDLHGYALKRLDHNLVTAGPAKIACCPHENLNEVMVKSPHLTRMLWFSTLLDAAIHREWIMKMEQLNADARLAHLFCELWHRLNFVGLAEEDGYDLPLTQIDLADTCGTTAIHMNRIIGQLRKRHLVDFRRGRVTIPDLRKLEEFACFSCDYLYGEGEFHIAEDY